MLIIRLFSCEYIVEISQQNKSFVIQRWDFWVVFHQLCPKSTDYSRWDQLSAAETAPGRFRDVNHNKDKTNILHTSHVPL